MATEATHGAELIQQHVVRNPKILGGEPTIRGTRVPVRSVVLTWRFTPEMSYVCEAYPSLTPDAVTAALAFYEANRPEIDGYIAENDGDDG